MIIVSGQFRFPSARIADSREAMDRVVTATRAALDAHFATAHMAALKTGRGSGPVPLRRNTENP